MRYEQGLGADPVQTMVRLYSLKNKRILIPYHISVIREKINGSYDPVSAICEKINGS
jgi:hypothetical protein